MNIWEKSRIKTDLKDTLYKTEITDTWKYIQTVMLGVKPCSVTPMYCLEGVELILQIGLIGRRFLK